MTNLFEYAVKNKLRFSFKGVLTVEDLLDLSLEELDTIYKTLVKEMKNSSEESLLSSKSNNDIKLEKKIELVKFIVEDKLRHKQQQQQVAYLTSEKRKLEVLLEQKEMEETNAKSPDEIRAMIAELEGQQNQQ